MTGQDTAFSSAPRSMRVPKVAELVAEDLRREIARGTFAEGAELPTGTALLERYGISRPTLREALRVLASENLITLTRRTQGARVRRPSAAVAARYAGLLLQLRGTTLGDLEHARSVIEPPAARMLVARAADDSVLKDLRTALDVEAAALKAGDAQAIARAGLDFHDKVVELSGNTTLHATFSLLSSVLQRHSAIRIAEDASIATDDTDPANLKRAHRAHQRFVELVTAADADGAERLWRRHVDFVAGQLVHENDRRRVVDLF